VELAHEALISGWHRLGEWVNENREKSRLKERLLESAREWQKNSKTTDFLYRGAQLAIAEERFSSSGESLPRLGREFLEASLELKQRLNLQEEERKLNDVLHRSPSVIYLIWLIYKTLGKPRLDVRFEYTPDLRPPDPNRPPAYTYLAISNRGPRATIMEAVKVRIRPAFWWWLGKETLQSVTPLRMRTLPSRLEVAETMVLYLQVEECLLDANPLRIGVQDWLARMHWAPKKDLEKVQALWRLKKKWYQKVVAVGWKSVQTRTRRLLAVIGSSFVIFLVVLFFSNRQERPSSGPLWLAEAKRDLDAKDYADGKDYAKALPLWQKAADAGNADAMNSLGDLYYYGRGVAQDYAQARNWYQKAAAAGNPAAMFSLGWLYKNGQGVAQDLAKAREWFKKADAGDAAAKQKASELQSTTGQRTKLH